MIYVTCLLILQCLFTDSNFSASRFPSNSIVRAFLGQCFQRGAGIRSTYVTCMTCRKRREWLPSWIQHQSTKLFFICFVVKVKQKRFLHLTQRLKSNKFGKKWAAKLELVKEDSRFSKFCYQHVVADWKLLSQTFCRKRFQEIMKHLFSGVFYLLFLSWFTWSISG